MGLLLTLTVLTMKILSNVKRQWDARTSCSSSCWTRLSDAEKFPLKCADLIVTSVNPKVAPDYVVWCSDPQTLSKTLPLSVYLEIISTAQCNLDQANGSLTPKQSAQLIRRVEVQMRQQRLISPNVMVSCTCTKCELTEMDTQTTRSWTF